jgi:hypothetical protein
MEDKKEKVKALFKDYAEHGGCLFDLVDKVDEIYSSKEVVLYTNGNAFRKYQGQDKRYPFRTEWRKVKAVIYEIE